VPLLDIISVVEKTADELTRSVEPELRSCRSLTGALARYIIVITMKTSLHRIGNSQGVIIPKPLLAQVGLSGEVEMSVERDAIVLRRPARAPREGWADDAKALVEAGEDGLAWPEFANIGDSELTW
jgi:antitoxin MazE